MEQLTEYREAIDSIDEKLIELLGRRYAVCRDVARLKKERNIPMMQTGRVEQVKERCAALAPERPRSWSMTWTWSRAQPSATARSTSAY